DLRGRSDLPPGRQGHLGHRLPALEDAERPARADGAVLPSPADQLDRPLPEPGRSGDDDAPAGERRRAAPPAEGRARIPGAVAGRQPRLAGGRARRLELPRRLVEPERLDAQAVVRDLRDTVRLESLR